MLAKAGKTIDRILFSVGRRSIAVTGTVMILLVLMIVVDVSMRRLFNNPLRFSYELIGLALVIIAWTSILYTTGLERHITIDVLITRLPKKALKWMRSVWDFASAIVLLLLGWRSIVYALSMRDLGKYTEMLEIEYYPFVLIVAAGGIWAGLMLLVNSIYTARGKEEP